MFSPDAPFTMISVISHRCPRNWRQRGEKANGFNPKFSRCLWYPGFLYLSCSMSSLSSENNLLFPQRNLGSRDWIIKMRIQRSKDRGRCWNFFLHVTQIDVVTCLEPLCPLFWLVKEDNHKYFHSCLPFGPLQSWN